MISDCSAVREVSALLHYGKSVLCAILTRLDPRLIWQRRRPTKKEQETEADVMQKKF